MRRIGMSGMKVSKAGIGRSCIGMLAAALLVACFPMTAQAEEATGENKDPAAALVATRSERQAEYDQVSKEITVSAERMETLKADVAKVKKDFASITAALIQSAKTEKKLSQDIDDITARLEGLKEQKEGIHNSLMARRGVLAEVLGALQRMGLNPPPAILVKPEDALSSVRSAILLGAVVPELREQTEVLMADLKEMSRVTTSIEAERQKLVASVGEQLAEKERLTLLQQEKERLQAEAESALAEEKMNAEDLAARAKNLKDLIAALEKQAEKTRSEASRRAEEQRRAREAELAALPEANRLMAAAPFSALRGQIALPVTGRISKRFGQKDASGGVMLGDMVATQSGAIVTAPADGNVLYAGPFRSYGQLLILNAGDGYHVVLAGMSRISVSLGQSVLAGEPIGAMGEARVASTSAAPNGNSGPELYIEFRKDGKPVDPTPWWAERLSGRTENGT
ncbi:septal ring factor EnvC (AmiA/AmiB activator) [Pseudaminobacter salicylatoxidans]|uniref:Septal ring factor EnvC (AmiA/AmiB activator) n=2 Tax=Pseudaminobacter salicylatoxidans TaxID=93369 RepID=A0A316C597_PSESE|nr:septal ring factor EnvC (AmiA/AmiB activator) [Pseudaminobacter salicylatoxidans]